MNIAYGEKCIATALLRRFRSLLREDFETTSARRFLSYTFALFPGRRIIARRTIESFAEVVLIGFCIDESTFKNARQMIHCLNPKIFKNLSLIMKTSLTPKH